MSSRKWPERIRSSRMAATRHAYRNSNQRRWLAATATAIVANKNNTLLLTPYILPNNYSQGVNIASKLTVWLLMVPWKMNFTSCETIRERRKQQEEFILQSIAVVASSSPTCRWRSVHVTMRLFTGSRRWEVPPCCWTRVYGQRAAFMSHSGVL